MRFRLRPNAFLQTNTEMAERLYALARDGAALTGAETVYDLYCGTGTIGLALAGVGGVGVGGRDLRGIRRVRDRERDAERNLQRLLLRRQRLAVASRSCASGPAQPDVVVVDPPRAGLAGKALRRTGALQAPRLVYVSCNPTTLAGDLQVLCGEYGYDLVRCTPVDMFPHTPHIESVSVLRLRDSGLVSVTLESPAARAD